MTLSGFAEGFEGTARAWAALAEKLTVGFTAEIESWGTDVLMTAWVQRWPRPYWASLAERTIRDKIRLGFELTPLIRTHRLQDAATKRGALGNVFETSMPEGSLGRLRVGVDGLAVPYAAAQAYGYERTNLPARPWDAVDADVLDALAEEIAGSLRQSLRE